jgi:hypothetical protein
VRRWTDGSGALTLSPEATLLEIRLAGAIEYRTDMADSGGQQGRMVA